MDPVWSLGLMTGTVLDGNVDLALLRTDGETVAEFGPWALLPYPPGVRELLARALEAALAWGFEGAEPAVFAEAEAALTRAQSDAARAFLRGHGARARVVGFHGQTVLHRPAEAGRAGCTRQLGDGGLMARLLGVDVAWDFRSADVAAGGQGAPLAPVHHAALLRGLPGGADGRTAVLNLGGVGNVTACGPDGVTGFDTGPANAPLNDWVERHTGAPMDRDGVLALSGRVDEARLARLLEHEWLARPPPKSLDRFGFRAGMAEGLSLADGAATLVAFSCACVGRGLDLLARRPERVVVCGGGRRNPAMMEGLRARAAVEAVPAEAVGWRGDAVEAECFALLAVRVLRGLPISFPGTTGVARAMTGGRVARKDAPLF